MSTITAHPFDPAVRSASRLRCQADQLDPIVAQAFRRRASEVEFESWLGPLVDLDVDPSSLELSIE